jgi:hypothetical protein
LPPMQRTNSSVIDHVMIVSNVMIVLVFSYVLINRGDYSFMEATLAAGGLCLFLLLKNRQ